MLIKYLYLCCDILDCIVIDCIYNFINVMLNFLDLNVVIKWFVRIIYYVYGIIVL